MANRAALLTQALKHVPTHGFTRTALSLASTTIPSAWSSEPPQPLTETAINTLFGTGDDARRTLIEAWLADARSRMRAGTRLGKAGGGGGPLDPSATVRDALEARLAMNESVLQHLPEAFALLATPTTPLVARIVLPLPPLNPRPALAHATGIAHEACKIAQDPSDGTSWYTRRAALASAYATAELHQLTSPHTARAFLRDLLDAAYGADRAVGEVALFGNYVARSWTGIVKSAGVF